MDEVGARARAELEEHGLGLGEVHDAAIVSWTELMKQAEHCGCFSMPTLNQTGELNAIFWWTSRWVSSAWKVVEVRVAGEVALGLGPAGDRVDDAIDELADARLALRGVEVAAEVLADTTTLVASWDQKFGTSTSFCSKTLLPLSLEMPAVRYSQVISS